MKKIKITHKTSYLVTMAIFFLVWLTFLIIFISKQNNAYNSYLSIPEEDTSLRDEKYAFYVEFFLNKFIVFLISTVSLLLIFPIYQSIYFYILTLKKASFKKKYQKYQLGVWAISIVFSIVITLVYLDQYHDTYLHFMTYGVVPLMTFFSLYFGFMKIY
ncbi:hypothetical protein LJC17_03970 [Acholeplasma sp. OttesenSCG-928-E16]|nr:hypothetical protein [Acholeplasma sp. OttesenSCG-928-E16]